MAQRRYWGMVHGLAMSWAASGKEAESNDDDAATESVSPDIADNITVAAARQPMTPPDDAMGSVQQHQPR